jgi:hypothetical protein
MSFSRSASGLYLPQEISRNKGAGDTLADIEMFARNGRVIMRKPDENGVVQENSLAQSSARARLGALGDMIARYKEAAAQTRDPQFRERARVTEVFASRLDETIKKAEEQGEYEDESMRRARLRSRPVSVSMASIKKAK